MNNVVFLKCICDETRFKMLDLLQKNKELCVNDLVSVLKKDQPLISHHLKSLKQCGIIRSRENGKMTMYSISNKEISHLISDITKASEKIAVICKDPACCT
jgi:DNA-binding transcriptional ArsR family regulator